MVGLVAMPNGVDLIKSPQHEGRQCRVFCEADTARLTGNPSLSGRLVFAIDGQLPELEPCPETGHYPDLHWTAY